MKILIVEDDAIVEGAEVKFMRQATTWQIQVARNGTEAREKLEAADYAAVVIDWTLPPSCPSGLELCRWCRAQSGAVGILFASARQTLVDRLAAFEAGADDYLVKPFAPAELLARIKSVARRAAVRDTERLVFETISLDPVGLIATIDGRGIVLPMQEYRLLSYFMRNVGRAVGDDELRQRALFTVSEPEGSTVRTLVNRLRKRLGHAGNLIETVRGVGRGLGIRDASNVDKK